MNERINKILKNPIYQGHLKKIIGHEVGRDFCKHDLPHFLDTARIAYILNLEGAYGLPKDIIYGAALLHDIGRWQEYESGAVHAEASALLCEEILREADYHNDEMNEIKQAISNHGTKELEEEHLLSNLLYRADKQSRGCYNCKIEGDCDWSPEKKNHMITY